MLGILTGMSNPRHLSERAPVTGDRLLAPPPAAEYLGVRPQTLAAWRCNRRYPLPFIRVGRSIKYRESDLRAFLDLRSVNPEDIDD